MSGQPVPVVTSRRGSRFIFAGEVFYPPDPKRERNSRLKSAAPGPAGRTKGIVIPASVSFRILSPREKRDRGRRKRWGREEEEGDEKERAESL